MKSPLPPCSCHDWREDIVFLVPRFQWYLKLVGFCDRPSKMGRPNWMGGKCGNCMWAGIRNLFGMMRWGEKTREGWCERIRLFEGKRLCWGWEEKYLSLREELNSVIVKVSLLHFTSVSSIIHIIHHFAVILCELPFWFALLCINLMSIIISSGLSSLVLLLDAKLYLCRSLAGQCGFLSIFFWREVGPKMKAH